MTVPKNPINFDGHDLRHTIQRKPRTAITGSSKENASTDPPTEPRPQECQSLQYGRHLRWGTQVGYRAVCREKQKSNDTLFIIGERADVERWRTCRHWAGGTTASPQMVLAAPFKKKTNFNENPKSLHKPFETASQLRM